MMGGAGREGRARAPKALARRTQNEQRRDRNSARRRPPSRLLCGLWDTQGRGLFFSQAAASRKSSRSLAHFHSVRSWFGGATPPRALRARTSRSCPVGRRRMRAAVLPVSVEIDAAAAVAAIAPARECLVVVRNALTLSLRQKEKEAGVAGPRESARVRRRARVGQSGPKSAPRLLEPLSSFSRVSFSKRAFFAQETRTILRPPRWNAAAFANSSRPGPRPGS